MLYIRKLTDMYARGPERNMDQIKGRVICLSGHKKTTCTGMLSKVHILNEEETIKQNFNCIKELTNRRN